MISISNCEGTFGFKESVIAYLVWIYTLRSFASRIMLMVLLVFFVDGIGTRPFFVSFSQN